MISPQAQAAPGKNKLPPDAANALHSSNKVILYSLEPWGIPSKNDNTLEGFRILGQTTLADKQATIAIAAFESAILKKDAHIPSSASIHVMPSELISMDIPTITCCVTRAVISMFIATERLWQRLTQVARLMF